MRGSQEIRDRNTSRSIPRSKAKKPSREVNETRKIIGADERAVDLSKSNLTSFPTDLPLSLLAIDLSYNAIPSLLTSNNSYSTMSHSLCLRNILEINLSHNQLHR